MDMEIIIYGIIGALAILVCWLLDIYEPTMRKESINLYSTDCLRSEKSRVVLPTCCICQKSEMTKEIGMREAIIRQIIKECSSPIPSAMNAP